MSRFSSLLLCVVLILPCMGCRRANAAVPELGQVGSFSLVDQSGQRVTQDALRGQIWAAAFIFTRCPTVCPRMMQAMKQLEQEARASRVDLRLVAFSVDPEHDTPSVLTGFAKRYDAAPPSWSFLTGDPAAIDATADSFKIAIEGSADPQAADFGILHGTHLVLVDAALRIRGYYRVRELAERARLLDDVRRLTSR